MFKFGTMDLKIAGNEDFSRCLTKTGSSLILCCDSNDCETVQNFDKKIEKLDIKNKNIWSLRINRKSEIGENCFYNVSCRLNGSIFLANESISTEPATDQVCFVLGAIQLLRFIRWHFLALLWPLFYVIFYSGNTKCTENCRLLMRTW